MMNDLNTVISLLNFAGLGGVGFFIYYLFKGLKERITNLSKLAEEQKQTLDAVRERAIEIDKLSQYYKQALEDFQDMGSKLENRRQELVSELEVAIKRKDEQLTELKKIEIRDNETRINTYNIISENIIVGGSNIVNAKIGKKKIRDKTRTLEYDTLDLPTDNGVEENICE